MIQRRGKGQQQPSRRWKHFQEWSERGHNNNNKTRYFYVKYTVVGIVRERHHYLGEHIGWCCRRKWERKRLTNTSELGRAGAGSFLRNDQRSSVWCGARRHLTRTLLRDFSFCSFLFYSNALEWVKSVGAERRKPVWQEFSGAQKSFSYCRFCFLAASPDDSSASSPLRSSSSPSNHSLWLCIRYDETEIASQFSPRLPVTFQCAIEQTFSLLRRGCSAVQFVSGLFWA